MKGTEKQIAWAQEIMERVISVWNAIKEDRAGEAGAAELCEAKINAIRNAEHAGDIISLFKDFRPVGDLAEDAMKLAAIYSVNLGDTDGQRKILGK